LLPAEFNQYVPQKGDKFDFSDFDIVKGAKSLPLMEKFIQLSKTGDNNRVFILTSRAIWEPVARYLKGIGANPSGITVRAIASADPKDKADWIENKVDTYGYDSVFFADDSISNVNAVREMLDKNNIKGEVIHIK
tara:strand:- start:1133 stop:1537 length:405 start_codon:yes stop_codon:yes gene_type:complete